MACKNMLVFIKLDNVNKLRSRGMKVIRERGARSIFARCGQKFEVLPLHNITYGLRGYERLHTFINSSFSYLIINNTQHNIIPKDLNAGLSCKPIITTLVYLFCNRLQAIKG